MLFSAQLMELPYEVPDLLAETSEYKAGSFNVDICRDGCSGIWLDRDELNKCDEHAEAFPDELLRLRKVPDVVIDRNKTRYCPECENTKLQRVVLNAETRFEVDTCPECAGHWLDCGELEHLRKLSKRNAEIDANLKAFEKKVETELKKSDSRRSLLAFIRVLAK